MADLRTNVQVKRSNVAPDVNLRQGANQSVEVNWGDRQDSLFVDLDEPAIEPRQYQGGETYYGDNDTYLDNTVSRDMGALMQQPQLQAQSEQAQMTQPQGGQQERPQKIRTTMSDAVAAGMRTSEQQRRQARNIEARIPVLNMPEQGMPTMSSRAPSEELSGLLASNEEMAAARSDSLGTNSPMPSRKTERLATGRREREDATPTRREAGVARALRTDTDTNTPQKSVSEDRPDSVFNRSFGYNQKDRKARTKQASTKRPSSIIKAMQKKAATAFKRSGVGYRIYQKMLALPSLDFREVGVGIQEIMAAIEQDSGMVNNLLAPFLESGDNIELWSPNEVADFINRNQIYVGTFKPPNNRGQDVQRRKLRILTSQQRGIYIHPIMAAMYTADFDGDDMEVSLDPNVAELARDPMDYMVGIDGKHSLNVDFLPVVKIVGGYAKNKSERDFIREVMFSWLFGIDGKPIFSGLDGDAIRPLVDAVLKLSNSAVSDANEQSDNWGDVFRKARQIADAYSMGDKRRSDSMMSRLCKSVYDGMHRIKVYNTLTSIDADIIEADKLPSPRTYEDAAIYSIVKEMVEGEVPNNFQELKVMMNGFLGNVPGKNAPFRFTADVGKMMKMDQRLQIGDGTFVIDPNDVEQMTMFFESTLKFAASRRTAHEVKKAGRSKYYTQLMRDLVISEVGFPESYDDYSEFLTKFYKSYNRNSSIINEANLVPLSNMGISSNSNRGLVSPINPSKGGVTLSDIAEPMLSIYGTYSVGRMFDSLSTSGVMGEKVDDFWKGNSKGKRNRTVEREYDYQGTAMFWVNGKYLNRSLRGFVHENRLIRGETDIDTVRSRKVSDLGGKSRIDAEFDMLLALADKRTGTASTFNENVYGMEKKRTDELGRTRKYVDYEGTSVLMMSELLEELDKLDRQGESRDQMLWVNDVVEALIASGPDMFSYFNMDSTAGFLKSKWAKKMIEHRSDLEVIGGIRTAMVFDYRMERITHLLASMPDPNKNPDAYADAWNNLELAKDELGAASEVWHGIISEFMAEESNGQESVFQMMRDGKLLQNSPDGRRYEWDIERDAREFWVGDHGKHATLRSVIEDLDLDRQTKWNVIADVVRYWEQDAYLKSYEVGFQLEIGNDSSYSLGFSGAQSALGTHRDFEQAFNRWGKMCQDKLREEVDNAFKKHGSRKGELLQTLQRLDSHPWELVQIDDMMYADSILSVKDKVYAQTEKASQHPWTNAIYAALSFQRNGGYMNDITRTDDRLLGLVSIRSVGIEDVVHILADPDAEMWVYNEYGEIGQITREILLQNALGREVSADIERDIWEFLLQEPRIASAIRRHNACVKADTDGTGYLGSTLSLNETISVSNDAPLNPIKHVQYLMRDHPVYAGIISAASPARGAVTRNERQRVSEIETYLSYQIYQYASTDMSSVGSAKAILADMGITQKSIFDAMRSNYDVFLESLKLVPEYDSSEVEEDAVTTYNTMAEYLTHYIDEVRENVDLTVPLPKVAAGKVISRFRGSNRFLSNMYDTPVTIDGITYKNAEAAFQAQKSVNPSDRIRFASLNGYDARKLGQQVQLRDDWDSVKEGVMRRVISAKFSNPKMQRMLEATGDAELVEGNTWGDTTWGVSGGYGQNLLGKILMDQRGIAPRMTTGAKKPEHMGVDVVSIASFWDVVQELGGAKTAVSTGIEGAETHQFAEWASHILAHDRYADLEAVLDDVDQSWDGLWTSLRNPDGNPILLSVDEDGTLLNKDEILSAKRDQGYDEIITAVPVGYDVRDRSTDSHNNPVPSPFIYMVSKRSNGAEAFNLKAKKAGLDGKDSVTKMSGKYRMVNDGGKLRRTNYFEVLENLRQLARRNGENGLMIAKTELAMMMMQENAELGYDDMTLSNYMNVADLMLIQGTDGQIYLRSLEMLFTAIKYRLGAQVDEMTDEMIFEAANRIVNDVSEDGVGIAEMSAIEAFDNIRPRSKSSSVSGIRSNSSVFERNYDLLASIQEIAASEGVIPMSPDKANFLDKRSRNVPGIKDVVDNIDVTRNYSVVGYAGAYGVPEKINWTIGPSHMIVIGEGNVSDARVSEICHDAWKYGMTVVVAANNIEKIPSEYRADAMPCSESGDAILPFFDARLNGSEAAPYNGGRFSTYQAPYSRFVVSVEDSINEHRLGDAQGKATRAFTNRIKVIDNGSVQIKAEDLFPNVFRNPAFKHCLFSVSFASGNEVRNLIADGVKCSIDYGVVEGGHGFNQRKKDVDAAIARYQNRWGEANADGMMMGGMTECAPGDIVAWAEVEIRDQFTGETQYVLAPIIPFQLHGPTKGVPEKFTVEQVTTVDDDNTLLAIDWTNTTSITDGYAKYFDSSGGANKGMIDLVDTIDDDLLLRDGTPVDVYIAKASTDSRKIGTDRRIKTMISLMMLARMHGYNFAESDGAFPIDGKHPENEEIRELLKSKRIPTSRWRGWLSGGRTMLFTTDRRLNAFLNYECRKVLENGGNPSDYLANSYTDANGVKSNTHIMWEFEAMFDQGLNYEDSLLKFLHMMDPKLCPNGIDDTTEDCYFRLSKDDGYDAGVLQMQVPHKLSNGSVSYLWDNVYIGMSFFGEDYSGFSRPNIDGASNFLDAMNTMSYYGAQLDESSARFRAMWASADIGRVPHDGGAIGKQ